MNFLATVIDRRSVRDISPLLMDGEGRLQVVPSSVLTGTTREERAVFGVSRGIYGFLTQELVDHLHALIAGRSAIEIGAGHGRLALALGIPATDNRQQETAEIQAYYRLLRQPTVPYGPNVEKLDAAQAVAKYKPQVVVASWVTHRYDPARHEAGGNQDGVVEEAILDVCDAYIFIGNEKVHDGKSIWTRPHEKVTPPWLYSRSATGSSDFIAVWKKSPQ